MEFPLTMQVACGPKQSKEAAVADSFIWRSVIADHKTTTHIMTSPTSRQASKQQNEMLVTQKCLTNSNKQ